MDIALSKAFKAYRLALLARKPAAPFNGTAVDEKQK